MAVFLLLSGKLQKAVCGGNPGTASPSAAILVALVESEHAETLGVCRHGRRARAASSAIEISMMTCN